MDPLFPGLEADLDAVDRVDVFLGVDALELTEDLVDEGGIAELDLVLGDEIRRIGLFQLADGELLVGEVAEEQRHADHGVATGMDRGIDDAAVAFAADQGADLVHEGRDVDLTDRGSVILAAMGLGHIAEGPAGAEVGDGDDGLAGLLGQFAEVVRDGNERVLLDEGFAVLADEGETVHVRVDADAEVRLLADDGLAELDEVLRERLGIVGEFARGLAVEADAFHAEALEEAGHDDAANGIDRVDDHLEVRSLDGGDVNGLQRQDGVEVLVREVFLLDVAEGLDGREVEVLAGGEVQDGLAFHGGEEFALVVKELEGVPLARVVRGGEDDAAVCLGEENGHFGRRGRCEAAFDDINAAADERTDDKLFDHVTAQAGVLADDHLVALAVRGRFALRERCRIGIGKLDDVNGGQCVAGGAADGAADTGNGFDERHSLLNFDSFFFHGIEGFEMSLVIDISERLLQDRDGETCLQQVLSRVADTEFRRDADNQHAPHVEDFQHLGKGLAGGVAAFETRILLERLVAAFAEDAGFVGKRLEVVVDLGAARPADAVGRPRSPLLRERAVVGRMGVTDEKHGETSPALDDFLGVTVLRSGGILPQELERPGDGRLGMGAGHRSVNEVVEHVHHDDGRIFRHLHKRKVLIVRRYVIFGTKKRDSPCSKSLWYWVGESNSYCEIENLEY